MKKGKIEQLSTNERRLKMRGHFYNEIESVHKM
jgi:hypothetical protein